MTVPAIIERLELAGYRFEVDGDTIRYRRMFKADTEDPKPLLLALKARKAEALAYLRARDGPHPADCVCLDCLMKPFFRPAPSAGADEPAGEAEGRAMKEVAVMGRRVRAYPTRPACLAAGGCLWLSQADCQLYAIIDERGLTGWCRERINAETWKQLPEARGTHVERG